MGSFECVQGLAKHLRYLGRCQEWRAPWGPWHPLNHRDTPQKHCLSVQAESWSGERGKEGPEEAAPDSQASAALCCTPGIEGSEMQNWWGRHRVGRLFPVPRWCEGPQVARCPEALGGNDLIHLFQIKIPPH